MGLRRRRVRGLVVGFDMRFDVRGLRDVGRLRRRRDVGRFRHAALVIRFDEYFAFSIRAIKIKEHHKSITF